MATVSQQDYLMSIAENVRELRTRRGMSQQDLAELVGASRPKISDLERGKGNPTLATLLSLAEALGTTLELLIKDHGKTARK